MKKGIFSDLSGQSKLGLLLLIIFISALIFSAIGLGVGYLVTGLSTKSNLLSDYTNSSTITFLKISQIFQALGIFVVPPLVAVFLFRKKNENYLQFKISHYTYIILAGILMIISIPLNNWFAELNQSLILPDSWSGFETWMHNQENNAANITKYFLKADNIGGLFTNLFIMAFLAAFGEEMLFRGVLQKLFTQISKNIHIAIFITAFIFSAIHMQFYTFLPRFFMGMVFGYLLVWTGSIWVPITAHFVNNSFAVISNYLVQQKVIETEMDNIDTESQYLYTLLSIILISSILYYINKQTNLKLE